VIREKIERDHMRELLGAIHDRPTPVERKSIPRYWFVAIAILVVSVAALFLFDVPSQPSPKAAPAQLVETPSPSVNSAPPQKPSRLDASGYIVSTNSATVSAEITGRLERIYAREGVAVKKGDILADLEPGVLVGEISLAKAQIESRRNAVNEIKVQLDEAKSRYERVRALTEKGFVGQQQFESEQFNVKLLESRLATSLSDIEVSKKQLEIQQQQLSKIHILAPFDGVVVEQPAQVGEIVSPISAGGGFTRTGICTLVDIASLEVVVNVNEQFIGQVYPGQNVAIHLQSYADLLIKGKVSSIIPAANRDTAAVKVRIAFNNKDPRVLPNMGVNVSFE